MSNPQRKRAGTAKKAEQALHLHVRPTRGEGALFLRPLYTGIALLLLVSVTACGSRANTGLPAVGANAGAPGPSITDFGDVKFASSPVHSRFAAARNKRLSVNDLEKYIDPSVVGNDRVLARRFMAYMPANLRDDFVYLAPDGHLVSNNPDILPYAKVTRGPTPLAQASASPGGQPIAVSSKARRPRTDWSDPCSPKNPPDQPKGAYVRMVSYCGFTAGWGFVTIPAGTSYMPYDFSQGKYLDNGHVYFEIEGPTNANVGQYGTLTEGGFEYYNDNSIAPYARSTAPEYINNGSGGYIGLTGGQNRYHAGDLLFLTHGLTADHKYVYMCGGNAPSGLNPRTAWLTSQVFTPQNAGWYFLDAAPDMASQATTTNRARQTTPCISCSVSKVVSIAQTTTTTWQPDGSYFGAGSNFLSDNIRWDQVAFGVYLSNCTKGTSLCTFQASGNPAIYYGGPQYYPYQGVSNTHPYPSGYGPYQTYDSVNLSGQTGFDNIRSAGGPFDDTLPPSCAPDSYGYCVAMTTGAPLQQQYMTCNVSGYAAQEWLWTGQQGYYIEGPDQLLMYYSYNGVDPNSPVDCGDQPWWSPAEPSADLADPNLP